MPAKNRTRQILGEPAQKAILAARTEDDAYRLVTDAAVYLASSGFLGLANELLTKLWIYNLKHSPNVWVADRAMSALWHEAGERPVWIPFPVEDIDSIELAHRGYMTVNRWAQEFLDRPPGDSPGAVAFRRYIKAIIASYPAAPSGQMPDAEIELRAIADFAAFVDNGCSGWNAFSALTNLVELCARNGLNDDARRYLLMWHDAFVLYYMNFTFECMPANRHAAPLLLSGVLAQVCELDPKSSAAYTEGLLNALDRRMTKGRSLVYGHADWGQLLAEISRIALMRDDMSFSSQAMESQWLGNKPASAKAICDAEARLGLSLPDDYKGFLRTSNGFEPLCFTSVRMFAIEEVQLLVDAYPDLVDIWNQPELQDVHQGLESSLLIGDFEGEQQLLLVPPKPGDEEGTWECWFFASWWPGEDRYPSFRAYMESCPFGQ